MLGRDGPKKSTGMSGQHESDRSRGDTMLRISGSSRGFHKVIVGCLTAAMAVALTLEDADARKRKKKRKAYNPPYAAIVVDANSGSVLHSRKADAKRHPASLTKIMTLYLLFEQMEAGNIKPSTKLKVSARAAKQSPTKLGLKKGQTITAEQAIRALVTKSANDAAVVVAEAIAGTESEFAVLMTRKARALGMSKTVYKNASGLPNRKQITTARDQARLGRAIQDRFPKQYRYFATRTFKYRGKRMRNHNRLLGSVKGVDGIKTGYIRASGFNLTTSMKRNKRHIVAVVMGGKSSGARNARMRSLLKKYISKAAVRRTAPLIAEKPVPVQVASAAAMPYMGRPVTAAAPMPAKPIGSSTTLTSARRTPATVDPIKPIAVKTIKVKLNGVKTASWTPPLAHLPVVTVTQRSAASSPPPVANAVVTARTVKPAAPPARPTQMVASVAPPAPVAAPAPKPVLIQTAMAPTPEPAPRKVVRKGWVIQVGAFDAERQARDRLSVAQSKAKHLLADADAFTETVVKNNRTFYRARFAGFVAKKEAIAACKYLKRRDFACLTLKN